MEQVFISKRFTSSRIEFMTAWICLIKTKKEYKNLKKQEKSKYRININQSGYQGIYQNKLDKTYFQHDMAYGYFKDLPKRTGFHKVLRDKAFRIAKNLKYDEQQRGFASIPLVVLL